MHNLGIQQLYEKIRDRRIMGRVALVVGVHRNTVRNQFTGVTPLDPEMVEAATQVLAEVVQQEQEAQQEIESILEEHAPLLAGLD